MNYVVIFAGGTGQRMHGSSMPKQFLKVYSKPIIVHTIEKFQNCARIDRIVVVCLKSYIDYMKSLVKDYSLDKVVAVAEGGKTGQQSIFNGLKYIGENFAVGDNDVVLIHDGVRPIIDEKLISDNIDCVLKSGSAITVSDAVETVAILNGDGVVTDVLDRKYCNIAKAPQSFYFKDVYANHLKAIKDNRLDFIDSATLMRHYGAEIHTVKCSSDNIKITTPMDYYLFKAILNAKEDIQLYYD